MRLMYATAILKLPFKEYVFTEIAIMHEENSKVSDVYIYIDQQCSYWSKVKSERASKGVK